tara:strand:- start:37 stop:894 length:858 start_codon:yes stop_codon:yes gene_type:complete
MKKIKILCSWTKDPKNYFQKMLKEEKYWGDFTLTNDKYADFYVIINQPYSNKKDNYYEEKKTIYLTMEPSFSSLRKDFNKYVNSETSIYYHNINGLEWFISKNYNELLNIKIIKTKNMSSITSDNYISYYHKKRVNFLKYLDKIENIDLYGRINSKSKAYNIIKSLKNYKGELKNKDDGLFPYKYVFVCENAKENNYFSEKLADGILSECLCFYCGCPNISEFINEDSYIKIDIDNPEEAIKIICESIETQQWEKRINDIKNSKMKILNELQLMPTIVNIINNMK